MMNSLEAEMNTKAQSLHTVTDEASKTNDQHSTEYLLGLLNQHKKWTIAEQLNATRHFSEESSAAKELLAHYDAKKPLAPQLAALMDAAKPSPKAKKPSAMLLQLVSSLSVQPAAAAKKAKAEALPAEKAVVKKTAAKKAKTSSLSDAEQLERLTKGLASIQKL